MSSTISFRTDLALEKIIGSQSRDSTLSRHSISWLQYFCYGVVEIIWRQIGCRSQQTDIVYNRLKDFRNNTKKENAWVEVAAAVGGTGK